MLKEIQKQLKTQNNRATANPIFIVYDYEKVPSCSDYTDDWEYVDGEEGRVIGNTKEELLKFIEDNDMAKPKDDELKDMSGDDLLRWYEDTPYHLIKFYYIKKRVFKNVFFTEKAADRFIAQNRYHFTKDVHTYVDCLWRNQEMQYLRDGLEKGLFVERKEIKGMKNE